ncbi:hypothetical protein FOL47_006030 [Perkinsus chesapeaki]|uniref:Nuclear envelope membrane protein n=1 Tax=Perkinsus chesapeaki TaxID=330153 RepID=A0A7J6LUG5_PERCH|nr:hypothetical protein FOL47_006030 [Perkinsus chesapeaki]
MAFNFTAYLLSRVAFAGTILVFPYWLNFMLNDPLQLGWNTIDSGDVLPEGTCVIFDPHSLYNNLLAFFIFAVPHSVLARQSVKKILRIADKPYERPLFAFISPVTFFLTFYYWQPISNCSRFDISTLSCGAIMVSTTISLIAVIYILGVMFTLPDHIFGTERYKLKSGETQKGKLITTFPYNLVRHPAGAGFLWLFWSFPSYNVNHIIISSMWTLYVVPATLLLEENSLRGPNGEFGPAYDRYAEDVAAFLPGKCVFRAFFGKK